MCSRYTLLLLFFVTALTAIGCGDGDSNNSTTGTQTLTLSFAGLPMLGADYVYEGWLIVDGAPITSGRFTVDASGAQTPSSFEIDTASAEAATAFILTIEPGAGDDPAPSNTHVLAGPLADGQATLSMADAGALGTDFASAAGQFILATPSTAMDDTDNANGIWFLDPTGPSATLELPTLPEGWVYEGWVVDLSGAEPMPISTGTFTMMDGADSDMGGAGAGPDGTPPFPGQDFITPARDLGADHMAVISVEPSPDDSPNPFQIKPLAGMIGTDLAPTLQSLDNAINDNTITGTASLQ